VDTISIEVFSPVSYVDCPVYDIGAMRTKSVNQRQIGLASLIDGLGSVGPRAFVLESECHELPRQGCNHHLCRRHSVFEKPTWRAR